MIHRVFSRPRFFDGRLLTAQDLQAEQAYHRDKARFRNLHLYGTGVISGLQIGLGQDRSSIIVSQGYAIDLYGRDICVPCDLPISLPPRSKGLSVWIRYAEMEATPTPALPSPLEHDNLSVNSQIEEGFEIDFASVSARAGGQRAVLPPSSDKSDAWLLLGVLLRKGRSWRLNPNHRRSQATVLNRRSTRTSRTQT